MHTFQRHPTPVHGARGAQIGVAGLLEAVTLLLEQGWQPTRTILLGFGQDEEVGGDLGAGEREGRRRRE